MELRNFFKKKEIKDTAQNEQDFYQKNPRKKFLKIFAAASLALITCATTLLATAPFGTGAASAATNSTLSNTPQTNSPLGLDPENDPVVYTTSSGLEIKYANALTYLTGYTYFECGGYNWVIIGYDPSLKNAVGSYSNINYRSDPVQGVRITYDTIDESVAGQAILKEMFAISSLAVENEEVGEGCVLCICETSLTTMVAYDSNHTECANYNQNAVKDYIDDTVYGGTSTLSLALQALPIVPQDLTNYYFQTSSISEDCYLFLLGGRGENFDVSTYLTDKNTRKLSVAWWLRSGEASSFETCVYNIAYDGSIYSWYGDTSGSKARGVRPVFVLQI